jgi:hypothetical protein
MAAHLRAVAPIKPEYHDMKDENTARFRFKLADVLAWVVIAGVFCQILLLRRNAFSGIVLVAFVYLFPVFGIVTVALRTFNVIGAAWLNGLFWTIMGLIVYFHVYRFFSDGAIKVYALAMLSTIALFGSFLLFEIYVYGIIRTALSAKAARMQRSA